MKILDGDPLFTTELKPFRIRPCTPAEAASRAARWKAFAFNRLHRRGAAKRVDAVTCLPLDPAPLQTSAHVPTAELPPWRDYSDGWRRICARFGPVFWSEDEAEEARQAYHESGAHWKVWLRLLAERERDRLRRTALRPRTLRPQEW